MDARVQHPTEESLGDLFKQLVDDGRNLATAESNLYKQIALYRLGKAKNGMAAVGAALFIANAGLVAFMVGLVMGLADLIGPVASGFLVLAAAGGIAYLLVRWGAEKLSALSGDPEEKAALAAGRQRA